MITTHPYLSHAQTFLHPLHIHTCYIHTHILVIYTYNKHNYANLILQIPPTQTYLLHLQHHNQPSYTRYTYIHILFTFSNTPHTYYTPIIHTCHKFYHTCLYLYSPTFHSYLPFIITASQPPTIDPLHTHLTDIRHICHYTSALHILQTHYTHLLHHL
jgi:hypothetical protein